MVDTPGSSTTYANVFFAGSCDMTHTGFTIDAAPAPAPATFFFAPFFVFFFPPFAPPMLFLRLAANESLPPSAPVAASAFAAAGSL
jgi:hypothetical protein